MLDRIKFPYFNMQQLNLDWLMDHIANMPEIVHVAALAGDDLSDMQDMIDLKALEIPKGISFVQFGLLDDPVARQGAALLFKVDNDNIIGLSFGISGNILVNQLYKVGGAWQ